MCSGSTIHLIRRDIPVGGVDNRGYDMHVGSMATKTITIDLQAYEALERRKRKGQSFSEVIKEHFGRGATGREFKRKLRDLRLDSSTLDALNEVVQRRASEPAAAPEL